MVDSLIDDGCSTVTRASLAVGEDRAASLDDQPRFHRIDASADSIRRISDLARRSLRAREAALFPSEAVESASAISDDTTLSSSIVADGVPIARLVVRDEASRHWSDDDRAILDDLAAMLAAEIQLTGEVARLDPERQTQAASVAPSPAGEATVLPLEATSHDTPASAEPEPLNILLADDLDLNRKLISDMLSIDGYTVDSVADGAAAVEAVKLKSYDLVLMDMIMPGMDGVEAARAIRALPPPACDVPIVALTAHSFREQLDNCLDAGMNDTLVKPMSFDALSAAVATWVRTRQKAA